MMSDYYLNPIHKSGRGAGGGCFIKDFKAFADFYENLVGDKNGIDILRSVERKNIELLKKTKKDIHILKQVYGDDLKYLDKPQALLEAIKKNKAKDESKKIVKKKKLNKPSKQSKKKKLAKKIKSFKKKLKPVKKAKRPQKKSKKKSKR